MPPVTSAPPLVQPELEAVLDELARLELVQSNCMFQLALMLARVAIEPGAESFKEESAQAMLALLRAKPKSNVVRLFGTSGGARRPRGPQMLTPSVSA